LLPSSSAPLRADKSSPAIAMPAKHHIAIYIRDPGTNDVAGEMRVCPNPSTAPIAAQAAGAVHRAAELALALALTSVALPALAQSHERSSGPYVVRSSSVASESIDEQTARANGVVPRPRLAVLNVVVQKTSETGARENVPAAVRATVRRLTGTRQSIDMRATRANGMVSYLGTYDHAPRQMLEFEITAVPEGSQRRIKLHYRDRMW
jgi:hypothetical protein